MFQSKSHKLLVFALSLALCLCLATHTLASEAFTGFWEGHIKVEETELEIKVNFTVEDGALVGTIDIPAQGGRDVPLKNINVDGKKIQFQISGVPGDPTFTGDLSEDQTTIEGVFAQSALLTSFVLNSTEDPTAEALSKLEGLDEVIESALEDWDAASTSIAIVYDDEVVYANGLGFRDLENEVPADENTLYAIGSATKAFTTFTIATLIDEGLLTWDQPVRELIPFFELHDARASQELTPRDMVTHRSGLPRHDLIWYTAPDTSREEFVRRLRYLEPSRPLREAFQYNNLMYLTAGYLTEVLTGKSWEDNVRERIFKPLGMDRSNFSVTESQEDPNHAIPYSNNQDDYKPQRMQFRQLTAAGPAGSINSSAKEMAQWVRLFLGRGKLGSEEVMSTALIRDLVTPQMTMANLPGEEHQGPGAYAHGWFVDSYRGALRIHHGGNIDGFSALVTLFPRQDFGVVVLTNQNASPIPTLATHWIADRLLEKEPKEWFKEAAGEREAGRKLGKEGIKDKERFRVKGTKPSQSLQAFTGLYSHEGYGEMEITLDGKTLVANYGVLTMPLEHWNYDVFNVVDENTKDDEFIPENLRLEFQADARGRIRYLHAPLEPFVDPIKFERIPSRWMSDPEALERFTGRYQLGPQRITINLVGNQLRATIGGGSNTLDLEPVDDYEFSLGGLNGYSIRFEVDEDDATSMSQEMVIIQPNGVFTATRIEE